jgi:hypothetical protein
MDTLPEVTALAALVEEIYPVNEKPLEDETISAALDAAASALFKPCRQITRSP